MNLLERLTIKTRLIIAFAIIPLLFLVFVTLSQRQINRLVNITTTIYEHPLEVSNAALKATLGIARMNRYWREAIRSESAVDLQERSERIRHEEQKVYQEMDVIKANILGSEGQELEHETRTLFEAWGDTRNRTIHLAQKEKFNEALELAEQEGRSQARLLEQKTSEISAYARTKADGFLDQAKKIQGEIIRTTWVAIFVETLICLVIAWVMVRSILKNIFSLKETMAHIRETGTLVETKVLGKNEIAEMAQNFNVLVSWLGDQLWLREGLNQLNDELSENLTRQELADRSMFLISRRLNGGVGAFYHFDPQNRRLILQSSFARSEGRHMAPEFDWGQGVVGQVALEGKPVFLSRIQEGDVGIRTGTQDILPRSIFVIPVMYENELLGVMEVASHENLGKKEMEFFEAAATALASFLFAADQREKISNLLKASQESNQALMLANNELRAQSEELRTQSTELDTQRRELERQQLRLEKADRLKSEFLSNMSHELRTPLNSILALSQLMLSRGLGHGLDKEMEFLEIIERNGRHLLGLINDILDLSKIESGKVEFDFEQVFTQPLAIQCLDTITPLISQKGLKIEADCEGGPEILSDSRKLKQILLNLLSNAIKFTEAGTIRLTVTQEDGKAVFRISDTGIGIQEEFLSLIFEEFLQVDGSMTRRFQGTGLGLPISRKLARVLGGDILVQSRPGIGSQFTLEIPLSPPPELLASPPEFMYSREPMPTLPGPRPMPPAKPDRRVLIVDDDPEQCGLLKRLLQKNGYETTAVINGKEGLKLAGKIRPAAITLDVGLPDLDGWEILKRLKKNPDTSPIPVIVISVTDDRSTAMALGAAGYLHKPVDGGVLIAELDRLTGKKTAPKVLVVDEDPEILSCVSGILKNRGYLVETAAGGPAGKAKIQAALPDLVILDLKLKDTEGLPILKGLRQYPRTVDLPVIGLSTLDPGAPKEERDIPGLHGVLVKSPSGGPWLERLEKLLDGLEKSLTGEASPPKILIVDDNEVVSFQLQTAIEDLGYQVLLAADGAEALKKAQLESPDAVVLDLMMPDIDGFEVLEHLRSTPRTADLPVLILTAKEITRADLERLSNNHIKQLIQKGTVDLQELQNQIELLVGETRQGPAPDSPTQAPPERPGSGLILVVEDSPDNMITLTALLDQGHYRYVAATDGKTAMAAVKEHRPDLVLMDVHLTGMSGLEAAQLIKADPELASIPVVAVTADAMSGARERILASGCDDYLAKPIDPEDLFAVLEKWFNLKTTVGENGSQHQPS